MNISTLNAYATMMEATSPNVTKPPKIPTTSIAKKANLTGNQANLSSTPFFMMRYDCVCPSVTFRLFRVYVFIPSVFA
jgi:hypothetical protein